MEGCDLATQLSDRLSALDARANGCSFDRAIAAESAPVGSASPAIGIVVGSGEIFGGGIAPSIAGYVAQHDGIHNIYLALCGLVLGVKVCLFLKETAPRKLRDHASSR